MADVISHEYNRVESRTIMVRHTLHLKAPGNWINDPNGFIYYKGRYHLFYQYFPYAPVWAMMHWGHAVSEDLIHWEHLGVALFPSIYEDQNGCFSGSAVEVDGKLNLYYTGIRYLKADPKNTHACLDNQLRASQLMISSEDGMHFDNFSGKRIAVPVIEDKEKGDQTDTRDPKVWSEGGKYYMILGSTFCGEVGLALLYQSADARNWAYFGQIRSKRFGRSLECPDLFWAGAGYVLIGSPMYIQEEGEGYQHHAVCMPVDFEPDKGMFAFSDENTGFGEEAYEYKYVDYGFDLYAPQTNVDREGRRVMIAWMRMPKAVEEPGKTPWIGMMSLPRVVEVREGHVYFRVHPEVEKYFAQELPIVHSLSPALPGCPCRVKATLQEGESLNIGGYRIWAEYGSVKTDRSMVFAGIEGHRMVSATPSVGRYCLDIFVDPNLIEVFVNEGEYVISNIVYGLGDWIKGRVDGIWIEDVEAVV